MSTSAERPTSCDICHRDLPRATRGRPRKTCSDRCRQIKRRRNYYTWIDPRAAAKDWRAAERTLRRLERASHPVSDEVPPRRSIYDWTISPRRRILQHLARRDMLGDPLTVPTCACCRVPYLPDLPGACRDTCSERCREKLYERSQRVAEALRLHAENPRLDPRVHVRVRLGLPLKVCVGCGIPFPDYYPHQKYCTPACRQRAYRARHPIRRCLDCGEKFMPDMSAIRKSQYCSYPCRQRHYDRTHRKCRQCRRVFPIPPHRPKRRFCSIACAEVARSKVIRRHCDECGEVFPVYKSAKNRQRFCSRKCWKAMDYRRHLPPEKALPNRPTRRPCEHCGTVFPLDKYAWSRQRFCSAPCRDLAATQRKRERRAAHVVRKVKT